MRTQSIPFTQRQIAEAAQRHAMRTEHVNFAESTTAIKPLTEEEKKAQLAALKQRLVEKRAARALEEKEEQKSAERFRRRAGQDMTEVKAKLEEKEMKQMVERKKKEKADDQKAKAAIKAQIEADKADRLRKKQEKEKGLQEANAAAAAAAQASGSSSSAAKVYTETRLQIRQPEGQPPIVHGNIRVFVFVFSPNCFQCAHRIAMSLLLFLVFQASDKLSVVYEFVRGQRQGGFTLMTTFPRKVLDGDNLEKTLNELELVPSGVVMVNKN